MENIRSRINLWIFISVLITTMVFLAAPPAARAEIEELRIGIGVDVNTFNPQESNTSLFINFCEFLFDTLVYQTPDGKIEPRLATRWTISPDGLDYTLHLRTGVKFTDGTPFDAHVMKQSLDRLLDRNVRVPLRFLVTMIKENTVVDDHTIKVTLKYPFSPFLANLSTCITSPLSPAAIKEYGKDLGQNPVGAGPYKLVEWVRSERVVMVRNDDYYGPKPTVKKLIFKIVPETTTREAMLRAGQIDICYKPLPANVAALKADLCPGCGSATLLHIEGCKKCHECGYSEC